MFGVDLRSLLGSSYTAAFQNRPISPVVESSAAVDVSFGLQTKLDKALALLLKPDILDHATPDLVPPALIGRIHQVLTAK